MEVGTVSLILDELPYIQSSLLSDSVVSETRLMALLTHRSTLVPDCKPFFDSFPPDINVSKYESDACLAFAWVTYTAGVGQCTKCRVSSYSAVQSDGELSATGYRLTRHVLLMMPTVTSMMLLMGTSTPPRENLDEYVTTLLSRSYAATWTALTDFIGLSTPPLLTTYSPALSLSRAVVDWRRVAIWLSIQLLVTASGMLFLWALASANTPLIEDTTLVAFYLDSREVHEPGKYDQLKDGALLRLERVGGRWRVKVEGDAVDEDVDESTESDL